MSRGSSAARRAVTVASRPVRSCVACRRPFPQDELMRLTAVTTANGPTVQLDGAHRSPGRGAYLCVQSTCVERSIARDAQLLRRALRTSGPLDTTALTAR